MVDDFFDKITSELYKQRVEQRKVALDLAIEELNKAIQYYKEERRTVINWIKGRLKKLFKFSKWYLLRH